MSEHDMLTDVAVDGHVWAWCQCGKWRADRPRTGPAGSLTRGHSQHVRDAEAAAALVVRDWFKRTGHCGACGNPGTYCTCRTECACAGLHEVGSGLRPDALDQFAEAAPVPVGDEQAELW